MAALLKAGSPLLEDLPLVGAAVLGISRKDETCAPARLWEVARNASKGVWGGSLSIYSVRVVA